MKKQAKVASTPVAVIERRQPEHARLRELMDEKRQIDYKIHAERLRLGR